MEQAPNARVDFELYRVDLQRFAGLGRQQPASMGQDRSRSGELLLVAAPREWFSYDYRLDRSPLDMRRVRDVILAHLFTV